MKKAIVIMSSSVFLVAAIVFYIVFSNNAQTSLPSISEEDFKQTVEKNSNIIVYYGQETCGSCISFLPVVIDASKSLGIDVYYLDYDKVFDTAFLHQYNIYLTPTLIVVDNGNITAFEGVFDLETTKLIISSNMNAQKDSLEDITPLEYEQLAEKMSANTDFVLYIGRPDCRDCQSFYPLLEEYIKSYDNAGVYYLDIKEYRDRTLVENPPSQDLNFYEHLKEEFDLQWVPSLYHIKNGVIISKYQYLSKDYYEITNEEDKSRALDMYKQELYIWMDIHI